MRYNYIFRKVTKVYPFRITLYVKKQIRSFSFKDPIFKMYYPHLDELRNFHQQTMDPYFEDKYSIIKKKDIPILVHKYPSRILIVTANYCPALCRFCMRKKNWGKVFRIDKKEIDQILAYIKNKKQIEEVLVSGGEPITLPKEILFYLLENLEKIDHVKVIRFATKAVLTAPNLFSLEHIEFFKNISKLIFVIHINHLNEIIEENYALLKILVQNFRVFSQTVLLKGVNDTYKDLSNLFKFLRNIGIKPYYLFDCDPVKSVYHFKVNDKKRDKILLKLYSTLSPLALPFFALDGKTKTLYLPQTKIFYKVLK